MYRVSPFLRNFGWSLLAGAALATLWVNLFPASYYDAIEFRLADLPLPRWVSPIPISLTPMDLTSDLLMSLFLFVVGKELWEALVLQRGALRGPRTGVPLLAMLGGLIGAALVWLVLTALFQTAEEAQPFGGWPVPLGSDVVLAWLVGRMVFGANHPALHMLLTMTVGADIIALLLLGVAYPGGALRLLWLALPILACLAAWALVGRNPGRHASERRVQRAMHLWPYALAGVVSWIGVAASGLPPALGLLPILPAIPHADRAFGLFAQAEEYLTDPLNRLTHLMVRAVPVVLFLFGLTRGGVDLAALSPTTGILLGALWIGKPLGILLGGLVVARLLHRRLPPGVRPRDVMAIAVISGMGFTVPLLALERALPGGAMQEAARLGLALSLLAGPLAMLLPRRRRR
mgnify:CR=1 FL=1